MNYKSIKEELETASPGWDNPSFLLKDPACLPDDDIIYLSILEAQHAVLQGRTSTARYSDPSTAREFALIALKRASVEGGGDLRNWYDVVALGNLEKLMKTQKTMVNVLNLVYNLKQLDFGELQLQVAQQLKHDAWSSLSSDEVEFEEISPLLPMTSQQMLANTMGYCYLTRLLAGYYQTLHKCNQQLVACIGESDVSEAWITVLWRIRNDFLQKTVFKDYAESLADNYNEHQVGDLSADSYSRALLDFIDAGLHTRTKSYLEEPLLPSNFGFENQPECLFDPTPIPDTYPQQSTHWFNQKFQCFTWHWLATNANTDLWNKEKFDNAYKYSSVLAAIKGYKHVMKILNRMESFDVMTKFDERMATEEYLGRDAASMILIKYGASRYAISDDYKLPYYVPKEARLTRGQIKNYGRRSLAVKDFVCAARPNFLPNPRPRGHPPKLELKGIPSKYFT